jgi:hypothetical protein
MDDGAGKALVVEHLNILFQNSPSQSLGLQALGIYSASGFSSDNLGADIQTLAAQVIPYGAVANLETKFYVGSERSLQVFVQRTSTSGEAVTTALMTGYLVNYP